MTSFENFHFLQTGKLRLDRPICALHSIEDQIIWEISERGAGTGRHRCINIYPFEFARKLIECQEAHYSDFELKYDSLYSGDVLFIGGNIKGLNFLDYKRKLEFLVSRREVFSLYDNLFDDLPFERTVPVVARDSVSHLCSKIQSGLESVFKN